MRLTLLVALVFGLVAAPELAAQTVTIEYYHTDAIGSVRAVTDAGGNVVRRYDYFPFGEDNGSAGPDSGRFAGKEQDPETFLNYFGARYYASRSGRFTTVDPGHVNGNIFDPQSWNAYAYARSNPLKYVDPTGTTYEICGFRESGGVSSCGSVSDQYFGSLSRTASGHDMRLFGGTIFVGDRAVGSYRQTSVDPTFNSFINQTGHLAARWLKESLTDMAKDTAIASATLGVGLAARASIGVMLASRSDIVFKTGQYASRLLAAGVSVDRAETAVQGIIRNGGPLHGSLMVDGVRLEYQAMRLTDGRINVGTIFPQW